MKVGKITAKCAARSMGISTKKAAAQRKAGATANRRPEVPPKSIASDSQNAKKSREKNARAKIPAATVRIAQPRGHTAARKTAKPAKKRRLRKAASRLKNCGA